MTKYYLILFIALFVSCKKEKTTPHLKTNSVNDIESLTIDNSAIEKFHSKLLISFYQSTSNKTVWLSPKKRKIILTELTTCYNEGLNPTDYDAEKLNNYEKKKETLSKEDWIQYDLMMTNSLKNYIYHLAHGKLNPRKLYDNWDLKENKMDVVKALINLQENDSLFLKIQQLKPNHIVYKKLKDALKLIAAFPQDHFKPIEISKKIQPNETNNTLIDIKKRLIYWKDLKSKTPLTNVYDNETFKAVVKFQIRHGLSADGVIGYGTVAALNFTRDQRKQQIIANLERWKWFPRTMGKEYIIVNIPDFKLRVINDKDTVRIHRIVVGTAKRETPVLSSRLDFAILNPTWTVPPTILKEDIIPETAKNKDYLASKNITVFNSAGNVVNANDWQVANAENYRYVQSPGTYNSLGMVKLNFPNRFSVYLHDTNHRTFFEKNYRSLSSGCVRVENPLALAEYVLDDAKKWPMDSITAFLKNKETKYVSIKDKINVHLLYWTAWSEKNQLIFRDDIYNLDADLYSKLGN